MDDSQTPDGAAPQTTPEPAEPTQNQNAPQDLASALAIIAEQQKRIAKLSGEARDRRLDGKEKGQEVTTLQQKLDELTKRLDESEKKALAAQQTAERQKIAAELKLPPEMADRLRGETAEELRADAATLAKMLPQGTTTRSASVGNNSDSRKPTLEDFDNITDAATINRMWEEMNKK